MLFTSSLSTLSPYIFAGKDADDDHSGIVGASDDAHANIEVANAVTQQIREGNADAFTALVREHYNALVRFAASLLKSSDDAEDLVQEVLTRVWNGRARLDPWRAIHTYLFTAVRNAALNRRRDLGAYRRRVAEFIRSDVRGEMAVTPSSADDLEANADAHQLRRLGQALAALPERSRTALFLRFERGMTHGEIGAVLGLSEKAAQQVVLRAIAGLRRSLPRSDAS